MKTKKINFTYLLFIIFLFTSIFNISLYAGTVCGERPDYTACTPTVPFENIILESGYTYARKNNRKEHTIGEVLIKIGIMKNMETIFGINSYKVTDADDIRVSGKDDGYLGIKVNLLDTPRHFIPWSPGFSILSGSKLPTGNDDLSEHSAQPEIKLLLSWQLFKPLLLDLNLNSAYLSEAGEHFNRNSISVSLRFSLLPWFDIFTEYYSLHPESKYTGNGYYFSGGIIVSMSNRLRFDLHGGSNINSGTRKTYFGGGFTSLIDIR